MYHSRLIVKPGSTVSLKDHDPRYTGDYKHKEEAGGKLEGDVQQLAQYQDVLYAQSTYALLIVFQAMDAAGKDSTIKHVMSGVNPQGCQVYSFKAPSSEELDHDFLWRSAKVVPERGHIGIFNRSHYEEVLVVRVHPELLDRQKLPPSARSKDIWKERFEQINNFEQYLSANGIVILKFFLHVSKDEQKKRFLERIDKPEKNWKFSASDAAERGYWKDYMHAYEAVFNATSTEWAPWYIVPADRKWFTRLAVADIVCERLKQLHLQYPAPLEAHKKDLLKAKEVLENEKD